MGMLRYIVFAALVCRSYGADIAADLNCTYVNAQNQNKVTFDATAVNCPNKFPEAECKALFVAQHAPVAIGSVEERPANCFGSPLLKQMAITNCPKWCGYCCISPAYNCKNKPSPRITCERITQDMCENPYWKPIIAEDCPVVCGFCDKPIGDCKDLATGCGNDMSICINIYMQDFVKENCKRTCGFCSGGGGGGSTADCGSDPKCTNWVRNGFCTNTFYTADQRKKYCGKPCGLC
ncbi:shTK domain protein [Ancylostoma ceylanicum]|uniref:ShTK domain protein n=1 Tax=Ancylostoma ceylanicum TaxID=53326 RepID=A0A0D6LN58_9BILA|nr:shTK domain protein [Ancylostoma ceylanicum]